MLGEVAVTVRSTRRSEGHMSIDVYAENDGNLYTVLDVQTGDLAPYSEGSGELFNGLIGYTISSEDGEGPWTLSIHRFGVEEDDYADEDIEDSVDWLHLNWDIINVLLDVVLGDIEGADDYDVHVLGTDAGAGYYETWRLFEDVVDHPLLGALVNY